MRLDLIINQIRQYCPALTTVGGSADFDAGLETTTNPESLPAAFVIPLAEEADHNETQTGLRQSVWEHFMVVVEFSNVADRRGQAGVSQVEDMRWALFKALLNWRAQPDLAQRGIEYSGGRLLGMDRARLWWSYEFSQEITIIDTDGYMPDGVDLVHIHVDATVNQPHPPAEPEPPPVETDVVFHPPIE